MNVLRIFILLNSGSFIFYINANAYLQLSDLVLIIICVGRTLLLNTLICCSFFSAVASNMRQFVRIGFPMHWIWEVFPMTGLSHGRSCASIGCAHATDAAGRWPLDADTCLRIHDSSTRCEWLTWTAMINSTVLPSVLWIIRVMSAGRIS